MKCLFTLLAMISSSAFASVANRLPISELGRELQKNLAPFEQELSSHDWIFNYTHVRVGASIAFEIPELVEVQVMPEFMMIWTKNDD